MLFYVLKANSSFVGTGDREQPDDDNLCNTGHKRRQHNLESAGGRVFDSHAANFVVMSHSHSSREFLCLSVAITHAIRNLCNSQTGSDHSKLITMHTT
jgi:hypothetical protein